MATTVPSSELVEKLLPNDVIIDNRTNESELQSTIESNIESKLDETNNSDSNNTDDIDSNIRRLQIETTYGNQSITIIGDITSSAPVIVTYHDIGINHNACYASFFNMVRSYDSIFQYFTIVHIDAPGHGYNDTAMDDSIDIFEMDTLAIDLDTILRSPLLWGDTDADATTTDDDTKIESKPKPIIIGMGVGAGCNIWLHYIRNLSRTAAVAINIRGLILLNPTMDVSTWREWLLDKSFSVSQSKVATSLWSNENADGRPAAGVGIEYLRNVLWGSFLPRYFPFSNGVSEELTTYFCSEFEKLNTQNIVKFFRGFVRRPSLMDSDNFKHFKGRILVLTGERTSNKDNSEKCAFYLPKALCDHIIIRDGAFLLTESHPQFIVQPIEFFLNAVGLYQSSLNRKFPHLKKH